MKNMKQVTLELTSFSASINRQLKKQGIDFDPNRIKEYQKDADAINRLYYKDLLSASHCDDMRRKLTDRIIIEL